MKTKELADWLGLATSTIRTWAGADFKRYLSPTAQGGEGRARNFTDEDSRIIAFIAALKNEQTPSEEIHATLQRMQADGWADLPPMPPAPPGAGPIPLVSREQAETVLSTQRSALMREIALLGERVENLEDQLAAEREKNATLHTELEEARERLGELRGKLEALDLERLPSAWWLRLVVLLMLAIVLTVGAALVILALSGR